jgi:excisionase family DNA binding protein
MIEYTPITSLTPEPLNIQLLTVPQAAEILGISKSLLYQLVSRGDVKSIRIGRLIRIKTEDLLQFLEEGSP